MKTELTPEDQNSVWKVKGSFLHYFWEDGWWWAAPIDPRNQPMLTNVKRAYGQLDGKLTVSNGVVEAP